MYTHTHTHTSHRHTHENKYIHVYVALADQIRSTIPATGECSEREPVNVPEVDEVDVDEDVRIKMVDAEWARRIVTIWT